MTFLPNSLELLAPARTADIGRQAVLHGADAVYIGGPAFGARASAGNPVADIAGLVTFAHRFGARVFVTLNTILEDAELAPARKLIYACHEVGVDALIVQDMGLLALDLPPIALHASTQCDIRTPEKARFLSEVGFSQLVLARELTLEQVRAVRAAVKPETTLEFFVHGALCVCFSGQCYLSHAHTGRSANRGECSQPCRLRYTLRDEHGRIVAEDKHLLSLKDNDQAANLRELVDAGVRSFKIEGRYKDTAYVKNVTAHYRQRLDDLLEERPDLAASSAGRCTFDFTPSPAKSFNRGSTDYFVRGRRVDMASFDAPSHVGQLLGKVSRVGPDWFELDTPAALANGDGLTWMHDGTVHGVQADLVHDKGGRWRVVPNQKTIALQGLAVGTLIRRNRDHLWERTLLRESAQRRVGVFLRLGQSPEGFTLSLVDDAGVRAEAHVTCTIEAASNPQGAGARLRENLGKLGASMFFARSIEVAWHQPCFIPTSIINALRRSAVERLEAARLATYARPTRSAASEPPAPYPEASLSYRGNVFNHAARRFYALHGVKHIDAAYEAHEEPAEVSLMTTKHCLRHSFDLCPRQGESVNAPMTLTLGKKTLRLCFDCESCEMHVMGKGKRSVLK